MYDGAGPVPVKYPSPFPIPLASLFGVGTFWSRYDVADPVPESCLNGESTDGLVSDDGSVSNEGRVKELALEACLSGTSVAIGLPFPDRLRGLEKLTPARGTRVPPIE